MAIQNDLTWGGDFTGPIDGEFSERLVAGREGLSDAAQESGHRRDEPGGAQGARRRRRAAEARGRLAARRGSGDRRARRPARPARHQGRRRGRTARAGPRSRASSRSRPSASTPARRSKRCSSSRRKCRAAASPAARCRPDSFVISGMQGLKKMVRARRRQERRGARHHHPLRPGDGRHHGPAGGADVERLRAVRHGLRGGGRGRRRRAARSSTAPACSYRPMGHVLTDRQLIDGCNVIALPGLGNAERIATDAGGELALLRVYGARNLVPIGMIGAASGGPSVTLVGIADPQMQGGGAAISAVTAKVGIAAEPSPLETAPALGFSGAAALDAPGPLRRHGGDEGAGGRRPEQRRRGRPWCRPSGSGISSRPTTWRRRPARPASRRRRRR